MIGEYGKSTVRQRKINRRVALRRVMLALIVLCVAAIGIRAGAGFDSFVLFPVGRVEVYGNGFVTKTEVLRLIGLDANRSILTFRRGRARKRLLADKRVQGAEIVKLLPDTLRVYVVEKSKKMLLEAGGQAYWLSKDGVVLGAAVLSGAAAVRSGPVVTLESNIVDIKIGGKPGNILIDGILAAAGEIEKEHPGFYGRIQSFSVEQDGVHLLLSDARFQVYLGNTVTKEKLEQLRALLFVLNTTYPAGRGHAAIEIDMSFSQAAVRQIGVTK
jgi:hypothetical protein